MHELKRIERALAEQDLDPLLFERCAQDLLSENYPGISPVPGGADWGRDADLHDRAAGTPLRLMVTKSRNYSDIRTNMIGGLDSLKQHAVPYDRIVLANPGLLSETQRSNLRKEAAERGARLDAIYDHGFFASRLRRDGQWRSRLLGLSGDPITVSRVPWRLAESPWSNVPLVGRQLAIEEILGTDADVILIGKPGVGKTRLLVELPNAVFVDPDAAEDRLADDLRWLTPELIILDDVGQTPRLARFVQRLRRQEAEWLRIRLVVVCWPDELEEVRDLMQGATEIALDLLERPDVDTILQAMGITGVLARQEILNQAEGRPGWAVALGDLLLRSGWEGLVTGKALLGQVDGYLRRSLLSINARDLLAAVAALRGVDESELTALAETVGVSRPNAGRLLRAVAQGGLLDADQRHGTTGLTRWYSVRPPMLADALATEHYFLGDVPLGDIEELLQTWSDRRFDIVVTACTAARFGSEPARAAVDGLVERLLDDGLSPEATRRVFKSYLAISERTAARVVTWLREEFDALDDDAKADGYGLHPIVDLAYLAAARYSDREGVRLMLDVAVNDRRETNPHPEHPLRKLADLATQMHPDLPFTADHRVLVAQVLEEWLPQEPKEDEWRVWTAVAHSVMTPHARGTYTTPEDAHRFTIIERIVTPDQARVILEELWNVVVRRLGTAPPSAVSEFVQLVHEWLRVGGGYNHPLGKDHPQQSIERAAVVGRAIFTDLLALAAGRPGLTARLSGIASMFDIEMPKEMLAEAQRNPFCRDVDRLQDRKNAVNTLRDDIADEVSEWAAESPRDVVRRLIELRAEVKTAQAMWPDRVWMACQTLALAVDDPRPWVEASLAEGLFPEAGPFVEQLVARSPGDSVGLVRECIQSPAARGVTLSACLTTSSDSEPLRLGVDELQASDFGLLDMLAIRNELPNETQRLILTSAPDEARGAFAIALAGRREDPSESIDDEVRPDFLAAVLEIRPTVLNRTAEHQLVRLIAFLSGSAPEVVEELIRRRLTEAPPGGLYEALGYDLWDELHILPSANKTSLFASFEEPGTRRFLLEHLVGPDVEWLESLLDEGVVTPDEALPARGFHGRIPIDLMAMLLVPRGIEPASIAGLAYWGSWTGEQSARYQSLVDQFAGYAVSDDPAVAAVGRAGVEIFTRTRDEALTDERQRRIRGEM